MGIEKEGREMCDRSGKCEFIVTDDAEDCEYDTTTSEPWLNAQAEQQESQYSHAQRSYSGKSKRSGKNSNAMMFAAANGETTSTVEQAMQTQVSLATLLMFVVAAVALYQMYSCVAQRNGGGDYKQIRNADTSAV